MATGKNAVWDWEIKARTSWWGSSPAELWSYRHLLVGLIRRDFLLGYQQTILGPFWVLLQPVMTMVTYVLVFGKIVGVSTGQVPPVLFYLAGIVLWNLFNDSFMGTSGTFRDNAHLFSKVYFPRLVLPFAQFSTYLISYGIQFLFLLLVLGYYSLFNSWHASPLGWMLLVPFVTALVGAQSLAWGLLFSVFTGKYRDLKFVVGLGVRLLMFLTPVIYPVQYVAEKWRWVVELNPSRRSSSCSAGVFSAKVR
ncbi:ABC transporter permease [Hymenobacter humi]|uniref:ABC transporter permease n=1 Tax=Hymenobacter humi TaxID=1411620 RepID=A0ABW2UGL3_9BACT